MKREAHRAHTENLRNAHRKQWNTMENYGKQQNIMAKQKTMEINGNNRKQQKTMEINGKPLNTTESNGTSQKRVEIKEKPQKHIENN